MTAELNRQIENLIRFGTIAEVDHQQRRARVQSGKILTDWLPWVAFRAGTTKIWSSVNVGEQCLILAANGELTTAVILSAIFSLAHDTPSHSPDEHVIEFADGAKILYNQASSALNVTGIKTAHIVASESVTAETPKVICTQDVEIGGNLLVKGGMTTNGSVTIQGSP